MKYKNFGIVITCLKYSDNLKKVLFSISEQSIKPKQVVVCYSEYHKFFSNNKLIKYVKSKYKNQVYQRKVAVNNIDKKIDILIQLDDKIQLQKNCLYNLLNEWNCSEKKVVGIGLNCINFDKPSKGFLHKLLLINSNTYGEVLRSGYPVGWGNISKNYRSQWLNGGMVSWKYKSIKQKIKNRKFPHVSWCVTEDLDFSYKLSIKNILILSKSPKVRNLSLKNNFSINENFKRGALFSILLRRFVNKNKNLSLFLFYYSIIISSLIGCIKNILFFNYKETSRHLGKIFGALNYKKIKEI